MPKGVYKRKTRSIAERFWEKVEKGKKCWIWIGARDPKGYGRFTVSTKRRGVKAPRVAWFLKTGKWPRRQVLHTCDNPPCVRFKHFYEGTNKQNHDEKVLKGRAAKKLRAKSVRRLRRLYGSGDFTQRQLAKKFRISQPMVGFITRRENWKHVS